MVPNKHQWYALQVRPRLEKLVSEHLSSKGYEEYLPVHSSRRIWSDRTKVLEVPLFPGYTFCRFDIHQRFPILVVPGVLSVVGFAKIPAPIPEEEILAIRKVVSSGSDYGPWPYGQAGQFVIVERGPMAGLEGTIIRVKSGMRLIVSLQLLQRSVCVEIDRDSVEIQADRPSRATPHRSATRF